MADTKVTERVHLEGGGRTPGRARGLLGHPLAFLATALILLTLFGWTFVANPDRVAPTKDPAYYTWRTEALISEDPVTLLEIRGAFDMFAGGYRVAAPVIGGFLRQVAGISSLHSTAFLMVIVPVVTALLLAGFAYRNRRDPLIFHAVAFGTASLYLTPPFVGYLDNILCLFFLAAAIWFIGPARDSLAARSALLLFLVLAGFTHPTTLAIFCLTLGAIAFVRLLFRRFDLRSVVRDDGPMLATAFAAGVVTYLVWTVGIWGESASLGEAALPPPYGSGFFVERMLLWIKAMRPALNAPLFLVGLVGVIVTARRWFEDSLAMVSIVWLLPLGGLFGFLAGIAYPYYRFFNTTLAWVLLVGVGAYLLLRLFLDLARRGGIAVLALLGVAAIIAIFATNLSAGFDQAGWNDPSKGWISAQTRRQLDLLRAALGGDERPVVFVIDDETSTFQIWGFTKLAGNTSRYALPHGHIDQGYLYLGSLQSFLDGEPTLRGEATYDKLSPELLANAEEGIDESGEEPIVVVASAFNATGANAEIAAAAEPVDAAEEVWIVNDNGVITPGGPSLAGDTVERSDAGGLHVLRVLGALALLLVPGALAFRRFVPGGTFAEALGMVPALSTALLGLVGMVVLALARAPFSSGPAWVALLITAVLGALVGARSDVLRGRRTATP
ncbi:MAG: hypothetical protein ABR529_07780 [Actinomycetota bacterium]